MLMRFKGRQVPIKDNNLNEPMNFAIKPRDPTVGHRNTFVRSLIAIATSKGWKIHQMDVKNAFFNDIIEEEVCLQ